MKGDRRSSQLADYVVLVSNRQSSVAINAARVRRVVRAALTAEEVAKANISVAVLNNADIRRLNRTHLNHDYATDVLSFLFESTPGRKPSARRAGRKAKPRGKGRSLEGEIVVSAQIAEQTARRLCCRTADELALYLVHGVLHLCGYDDLTDRERRRMRSREAEILGNLGIVPVMSTARKGGAA